MPKPKLITIDFESILVPEIWMEIAKKSGVKELKVTTRDVADFDELMKRRLEILEKENIKIDDIDNMINSVEPLEGARNFLNTLRDHFKVVIVSDSFYQFAENLARRLDYPTIFCHSLEVKNDGTITGYKLRENGEKSEVVKSFQDLDFFVIAIGDSYNDAGMLREADEGILFNASEEITKDLDKFPSFRTYKELSEYLNSNFV